MHQLVQGELFVRLRAACPPGHVVFMAPIDYDLPSGDRVEPDLIVVPLSSIGEKRLEGPALLVVEIASPGSKTNDFVTKRAAYAQAGIPAYWIIDPARNHILALRLVDGQYQPYADTDGLLTLDWPPAVSFSVAELVRPPA